MNIENQKHHKVLNNTRLPCMDGMKFVMCLGIACLHYCIYFFPSDGSGQNWIPRLDYFNDIFFMASGYFLMRSSLSNSLVIKNYSQYIFMRFVRIYPLYFATLAFFILVAVLAQYGYLTPVNPDRYDLNELWSHIFLIQSWGGFESLIFNYPTWALSALWLMYIIFPAIYLLAEKSKILLLMAILVSLAIGECVGKNYCAESLSITRIQRCDLGILRCIPVFLMGVSLVYIKPIFISKISNYILLFITAGLLFFTPIFWDGVPRILIIYGFMLCLLNSDYIGFKTPLSWSKFQTLSQYSYAIYLVHPIIATVYISYLLPRAFDLEALYTSEYSLVYRLTFLISALFLSTLAAIVSFYIIEKPCYRFAQNIVKYKSSLSNPVWKINK